MCVRVCVLNGFVGFSECIDGYICAGNPTLPSKSTSSNYVGHLGRPEKLFLIYVFTSLECGAATFRSIVPAANTLPHQKEIQHFVFTRVE